MAFQPTPNGILAVQQMYNGADIWQNHFWFYTSDPTDTGVLQLVADTLSTASYTELQNLSDTETHLDYVRVFDMSQEGGAYRQQAGAGWSGQSSGDRLPPSLAIGVTHRTEKRGRSYRGRSYLSGFGEASMVEGEWAGALKTAVLAFFDSFQTDLGELGHYFSVHSGYHNGVKLTNGVLTFVLLSEVRSLIPVHQRKRDHRP